MIAKITFLGLSAFIPSILVVLSCIAYGQVSIDYENLKPKLNKAGGQNWDITQTEDGTLLFANNNGLLIYDGISWRLEPFQNNVTVRALHANKDKIYSAAYQSFGVWERDAYGSLKYKSLLEQVPFAEYKNQEFWQIVHWNDKIVFRSFSKFFIYDGNTFKSFKAPSTLISLSVVKDRLLVGTLQDGLLEFKNNKLLPIEAKNLKGKKINKVLELEGDELLIATELNGLFVKNGDQAITPFVSPINAQIKRYQLNKLTQTKNGKLIFGTIQNGIYITDAKGQIIEHLNRKKGLDNNTVLSMFYNGEKIWCGLDHGITQLNLDSPFGRYKDRGGNLGTVYDVEHLDGKTYIGTNNGLYLLEKDKTLSFIPNTQGQVWYLELINGKLVCGHNNGTYEITDKKAKLISPHTGGFFSLRTLDHTSIFLQGTYTGLVRLDQQDGQWHVKKLKGLNVPLKYGALEGRNHLWVTHSTQGVYRIKISNDYNKITSFKRYTAKEWSDYKVGVYAIKNQIILKTQNHWLRYFALKDSLGIDQELEEKFGVDAQIVSPTNYKYLVIKKGNELKLFDSESLKLKHTISNKILNESITRHALFKEYRTNVGLININDGFATLDMTAFETNKATLPKPFISSITTDDKLLELKSENEIPSDSEKLTLAISAPNYSGHYMEYRFDDSRNWSQIATNKLILRKISPGDHTIQIRSSSPNGRIKSPVTQYTFYKKHPWHSTNTAYLVYLLILLALAYSLYAYNHKKVKQQEEQLKKNLRKEEQDKLDQQKEQNTKELIRVKNESLQRELSLKSQQLADNALTLAKKDEVLLGLKEEIINLQGQSSEKSLHKKLIKKIDANLSKKDEWKVFENNFNQVHNTYFEKLKELQPKLTQRDLKLAAYIKMNMLAKEIAPLMGISVRGVETHKYRLKKKLAITNDLSLVDFLLKL